MFQKVLIAALALLFSFSLAGAEMYQWVDDQGVVTFKDTPPPASKKRKPVKSYSDDDFAPAPPVPAPSSPAATLGYNRRPPATSPAPRAVTERRFSGTVEIYVTDWCGYCKKALSYLDSKGVSYSAYDIEKDSAARQRHQELGGRGVPLIIVGSNRMSGFSQERLEQLLNGR